MQEPLTLLILSGKFKGRKFICNLPLSFVAQVPFGALPRVTVATFRDPPVQVSDSQQSLPRYEQEMEPRQAEDLVAMSQVLDLVSQLSSCLQHVMSQALSLLV